MRSLPLRIALLALVPALIGPGSAAALTLQPLGSFAQPTYVASDPGDADVLFVAERQGAIQRVDHGVVGELVDLSSKIGCSATCSGERGLLSIALAPDFDQSGRLFVDYANNGDGKIHVDELVATGPAHDKAALSSLNPLLTVDHADAANHNGGQLQIGPDGFLYVSTGDGGGGNDEFHHAQDPASPLGKILRLDPAAPGPPVVWSLGLRNAYRFSFDSLAGDMTIADVGQGAREEIDFAPSPLPGVVGGQNANYGWNCREGLIAGPGTDAPCASAPADAFAEPAFDYAHDPDPDLGGASRCSIIGGYVVRDPALGDLYGHYLYADYCGGGLRALLLPANAGGPATGDCSLGLAADNPVSFGEDAAHRIYVVEQGGQVARLAGLPPSTCPAPATGPPEGEGPPQGENPQTPGGNPGAGGDGSSGSDGAAANGGGGSGRQAEIPTHIDIEAERNPVERGKRALLTISVSPCKGRRPGTPIGLLRDGRPNGSHLLDRNCVTHSKPLIDAPASFAAIVHAGRGFLPGRSRSLRIRLAPARK